MKSAILNFLAKYQAFQSFDGNVPRERLELSRDNSQRLLRPQRLPISPPGLLFVVNLHEIELITFRCTLL